MVIPAYWLPWKKGKANTLTLGVEAKFMFTSEMTNCRFSVLTGDMAKPTVAHVEGTRGSNQRDELEVAAKDGAMGARAENVRLFSPDPIASREA